MHICQRIMTHLTTKTIKKLNEDNYDVDTDAVAADADATAADANAAANADTDRTLFQPHNGTLACG